MEIIAQEAKIMNAWMQYLGDHDCKDAHNVDKNISIVYKEMGLRSERAHTTENLAQDFVTHLKVLDMIAAGMENSASHRNAPLLKGLVEDKLNDKT